MRGQHGHHLAHQLIYTGVFPDIEVAAEQHAEPNEAHGRHGPEKRDDFHILRRKLPVEPHGDTDNHSGQ